jgi:ribokinase
VKKWFVTCGGINIDNVVAANSQVYLNQLGGNAVYSSVSCSLWSEEVAVVGNIPQNFPQEQSKRLGDMGFNTDGIRTKETSVELFEWFIYNHDGSRRDRIFLAADSPLPWLKDKQHGDCLSSQEYNELLDSFVSSERSTCTTFTRFRHLHPIRGSQVSISSDSILGCHLAPSELKVHEELIAHFRASSTVVTLDPGPYVQNIELHRLTNLLNGIDVFMPSEKEMQWLFPVATVREGISEISKMSSCSVIVKCGDKGSLLWDGQEKVLYEIEAYPTKAKDPTGAGDVYCGSFLANYALTNDLILAATRASAAASCAVETPGVTGVLEAGPTEILRRSELVSHRAIGGGQDND